MISCHTLRMKQVWHVARPKKILWLWLWWTPYQITSSIAGKSSIKLLESADNSQESLLAGDLSNATRIPKGYLAVYVGEENRRFVIPAIYLSMPEFIPLMDKAADEFGFQQEGGLKIPCDEDDFREILLRCLAMQRIISKNRNQNNNNHTKH